MYMAGHPRILNGKQVLSVCEQLDRAPEMYLDEIQDWVALTMQTSISKSALSELIQDAGYSFKMLHKAASEQDEEERAMFRSWARDFVMMEMVVTADESSKDDCVENRWYLQYRITGYLTIRSYATHMCQRPDQSYCMSHLM